MGEIHSINSNIPGKKNAADATFNALTAVRRRTHDTYRFYFV